MSNQTLPKSAGSSAPDPSSNGSSFDLRSSLAGLARVQVFQIVIVLLAISILFSILAPNSFPEWGNIRQIIQNVSILAVLGIGMTFVIVTSGIDLSIGSVLVFSGVVAAKVMRAVGGEGWSVAVIGILVAVACGLAWGLLNGFLIGIAKVPPLIATLGTLGGALGLAQVITGGVDIRDVPPVLVDTIGYGNVPATTIPLISFIALVFVIVFGIVLHRTRFGLHTFAVGSKEQSARRVGIKVDLHLIKVYALSGTLAGLAGILSLSQYGTTAIAGQSQTNLNVIAAVVIGGTSLFGGVGTMFGTVIGLFIPAVLQNGFVIVGVQPFWQQVAVGAVLIAAVYFDQRRRAAATRGASTSSLKRLWARNP
ncbi:ABC transporter permease [Rhodococcus sp. BP-349]|uniref:ABC transporter permease n=1 Tax=unclassified Rhodococcus (in: high G+C Gram-positive bacteria) TaxID=192944 RepID=UPI001C9B9C8A|nr:MULTISPECIES: ABC transporter permease [unclassified Rhodococcus (in: high G+C Gram-positive bacteria)]MBY6537215.1 ABC transporter permease [Rhodococcus sp. BP-363]MBY6541552.1 ABC transporter permease [Rhodococcus sp. BP-369]MBY6560782.1 ABC transporter permease [Rhodococcus sp. BP-370]MBY6575074.1 ABC transporter permease [Rhodococcus sp. BP-364]MBY6584375.1 ABC transporter permease [Rhodococcus sp. BP-358]